MAGWDESEKASKDASDLYVKLENDGDSVVGMFLGAPAIKKSVWDEHLGKSQAYDPAKHGENARVNVTFVFNFWNARTGRIQICDLTNTTFQDLIRNRDRTGLGFGETGKFAQASYLYCLERKNKKTYVIIPVTAEPVTAATLDAWRAAKMKTDDELLGRAKPGAAGASASGGAPAVNDAKIDSETATRLINRLKVHGRAIVDVVLPKFGVQKVADVKVRDLAAFENAIAIEEQRLAPAAASSPNGVPTEVDPFAPRTVLSEATFTVADLDPFEVPAPYLDEVFGEGGLFASRFPGYRPRPGQRQLARSIHDAFETRSPLLAEAPTGTGKSQAYLVPASHYVAHEPSARVVVVTANIALQEQVIGKDLPLLRSLVPWSFSFGLMKGRNNYLCRKKFHEIEAETKNGQRLLFRDAVGGDTAHRHLPVVYEWAKEQMAGHGDGDVSGLSVQPDAAVWNRFSTTPDDCPGKKCAHADDCFANVAQAHARASQILVTNYAMLLLDLKLYGERQLDYILGPFDAVVCDEAHTLGSTAQDFFGFSIRHGHISWLARHAKESHLRDRIESLSRDAFAKLESYRRSAHYAKRLKEPVGGLLPLLGVLGELQGDFRRQKETADEEEGAKLDRKIARAKDIADALAEASTMTDDSPLVFSIGEDEKKNTVLEAKLFRPAYALKSALFEHTKNTPGEDGGVDEGDPVAVVCLSATLATASGSLDFYQHEVGAPDDAAKVTVPSPFDWKANAILVTPPMPEPNDMSFARRVGETLVDVVRLAHGRTLALFTSYRVLDVAYEALVRARLPYTILRQKDAPRTELIRRFREDITSVLLGTESFWAGVDVPGESCSVVVVDRLPFPHFDDPVMDKHQSVDPQGCFGNQMLPRALLAWRQGTGRLLRSETDRGVLVCLDARLTGKGYGKAFQRAIGVPVTSDLSAIGRFLAPPAKPKEEAAWPDEDIAF